MHKLFKSSIIISFFTLISRCLGLIRDMVIANLLGAASSADIFIFANRIPNLFRRLFAEGSFSQAFIPVMVEHYDKNNLPATRKLLSNISGLLLLIVSTITLIGIIFSSVFVILFAFGWYQDSLNGDPTKYQQASLLLKITFPYLIFISLAAISGSILNTLGKYSVQAFTPIILNISIIICAYMISPYVSHTNIALAIGVFFGGLCQLLFQIPFLYRVKLLVLPKFNNLKSAENKEILRLMIPSLIGTSASQFNMLFNTFIASFLITGSISWLYYSERLLEIPLGIFGVAISTVLLPSLVRLQNNYTNENSLSNKEQINKTINWGITIVIMIGLPSTMGLIFLGKYLINLLFQHGSFTSEDTYNSSQVLTIFSICIVSSMLVKIFANAFYSVKNTKLPMYVSLFAILVNIIIDVFALFYGFQLLAVATTVSSIVNASLLFFFLSKTNYYSLNRQVIINFIRITIATIVMSFFLWYLSPNYVLWENFFTMYEKIYNIIYLLVASILIYFTSLLVLGIEKKDIVG